MIPGLGWRFGLLLSLLILGWFTLDAWYICICFPCFIWDLIHGEYVLSSGFCENGRNVVFSM